MKLNLGGGSWKIAGYQNRDRIFGQEVYPLTDLPDGCAEEIRASHVLEHFPVREVEDVIREWVRVLKPGGWLRIAVPDFAVICNLYQEMRAGKIKDVPVAGYLMGGQQDANDYHKAVFDKDTLTALMDVAGLTDIQQWQSEISDCANLPVSLNLKGRKRESVTSGLTEPSLAAGREVTRNAGANKGSLAVDMKVAALVSVPRLGWQDNFGSAQRGLRCDDFDIPLYRFGGAFWHYGMQNGLEEFIQRGLDWALAMDYDTVFDSDDVRELLILAAQYPDAAAIVPLQAKRGFDDMLFTMADHFGRIRPEMPISAFDDDLTEINSGHFGLTMINLNKLKLLPKPWLDCQPNEHGEWRDGRTDADVYFWDMLKKHQRKFYQANRVRIGHLQLVVSWVTQEFKIAHQYVRDYQTNGKPAGVREEQR